MVEKESRAPRASTSVPVDDDRYTGRDDTAANWRGCCPGHRPEALEGTSPVGEMCLAESLRAALRPGLPDGLFQRRRLRVGEVAYR